MLLVLAVRIASRTAATEPADLKAGTYTVRYVIDGDTLVLDNDARIRLQGIDTPEVARNGNPGEEWANEATNYSRAFVAQAGGAVRLTFGNERRDLYGRHLAFVWASERMLNEELVREGLAEARPDYRFAGRMKRRLLAAQNEAQTAHRGIWSPTSR